MDSANWIRWKRRIRGNCGGKVHQLLGRHSGDLFLSFCHFKSFILEKAVCLKKTYETLSENK
jgi:hypothetical protein